MEKINNLIFLVVLIIVAAVAVYVVYNFYYSSHFTEIASFKQTHAVTNNLPVITNFAMQKIDNSDFYRLQKDGYKEYNRQVLGVATGNSAPIEPASLKIIDPQIGRTLMLFWQQPLYAKYDLVRIYRTDKENGEPEIIADNLAKSGHYLDRQVKDNTTYYYEIRSVAKLASAEIESENNLVLIGQAIDTTPPTSPENVQVIDTTAGEELKISWKNSLDSDLAQINIYRSESLGPVNDNNLITSITDGTTNYTDKSVVNNTVYYYIITAVDSSGNESTKDIFQAAPGNYTPFVGLNSNTNNNTNTTVKVNNNING